jgi:cyclopropane-fatty-acyl-phospholipid synthase
MNTLIQLAEKGWIPDSLIRFGIRRLVKQRLHALSFGSAESNQVEKNKFVESLIKSPLALETEKANEQHYEVPAAFFALALGTHKKYSSCLYRNRTTTLDEAEADMLNMYCERGQFEDGMDVLELGCGWGSLTLWLGEHYPNSQITGVSNSNSQREYINQQAQQRGINNIKIITCDINDFSMDQQFDRVVSIEMFEHLRNYQRLFHNISQWLKPDGKLFFHIFTHKTMPYLFEVQNSNDWMSQYFFTGGMMPSDDLPLYFQTDLVLEQHWSLSGTHYEKTANHWLENMEAHKKQIMPILRDVYGKENEVIWFNRWRMFFMACAELFGYRNGDEWLVSHYLFSKRTGKST